MDWNTLLIKLRKIKEEFDRSYKCMNNDRQTSIGTINKHVNILIEKLEEIRTILNVNYTRLTVHHKVAAEAFFLNAREQLLAVASRKNIEVKIPTTLHEKIELIVEDNRENDTTMTQTVIEFLNTASKLICDFDGKSENLRTFIDSLSLVDTLKGSHENIAISLIKTKLKGTARNLISNEKTIPEIIQKLKTTVKTESVEVISAKLMNIKQNNKTANAYCTEIENLTKALENTYISDGLSSELASSYSTQMAVKAMTKNCNIDRVKLIMEAGQFKSMNEAISKFVNSCTEATGQQNSILYYNQKRNFNNNNRRKFKRGGYNHPQNYNSSYRNNSNNNYSNNRNNNNQNGQGNINNRRNYIRAAESNENDSEN